MDFEEFETGASSLTYAAEVRDAPVDRAVVKVAPAGLRPVANRDVIRQARVLRLLGQSGAVPVPDVYGSDAGGQLDRPPLFVMSHVDGRAFEPATGSGGPDPGIDAVYRRCLEAARLLARLHSVDTRADSLAGEPIITPGAELERWSAALATCGDLEESCAVGHIHAQLRRSVPPGLPSALTHGDYRLGNLLAVGTEIRAVIDWEIWSLGDPRTDLGWLLAMIDRRRADGRHNMAGVALQGEMLRAYNCPPPGLLGWFVALAFYKEIAILSLILKRAPRSSRAAGFTERIPLLVELALDALASADEDPVH